MTEPEAAQFADRLRRVWGVTIKPEIMAWSGADGVYTFKDKSFRLIVRIKDGIVFECRHLLFFGAAFRWRASGIDFPPCHGAKQNLLPLFRRNCFLSGANIEPTATEKMEWLTEARASGMLTEEECQELAEREMICSRT